MRIFVLGASGMIGHKVFQGLLASGHDVVGTVRGANGRLAAHGFSSDRVVGDVDAEHPKRVTSLLERVRPSVIVNCIGITKRKTESGDLDRMFRINTLFPHQLAHWAFGSGARVIQFSTDCVFDGAEGHYQERSVVTATDLYGQTKFFGELDYRHCLTIRTSMIGRELTGRTELLEWFLAQRGKTVRGFTRARYSGLTTNVMARIVDRLIRDHPRLWGRVQVAGPTVTKYDLLCMIRDAFSLDVNIVADDTFVCDRTLRSRRFASTTGITIPTWERMLADLAADQTAYSGAD